MKITVIVAAVCILAGCSSTTPAPNFMNGQYYMSGDPSCVNAVSVSPVQIACYGANGQATGRRNAMTAQQIQMYQFEVAQANAQANAQSQQMQQSIDYNNAVMANNTQQTLARASVYSPPVVQPLQMPGGNQVRCIGVGIYANCRW